MTRSKAKGNTRGRRSVGVARRGPQERGDRTRELILAAAEKCFAQNGYADTSMSSIAGEAGMHQPGIFYYFKTKRNLYDAVLEDVLGQLDHVYAAALVSGGTPKENLMAGVEAWIDMVTTRPTLANLLLREAANTNPETTPSIIPTLANRWQALIVGVMSKLQPDVHPDDVHYFEATITGSTLFYATALQRFFHTPDHPDIKHSMERHKQLLLKTMSMLLTEFTENAPSASSP